jgi:hypothetical protein
MTQYQPAIDDLLRTVREFITSLGPSLTGEQKYHALVASYLLTICERELTAGPGYDRAEAAALTKFLKADGPLDALRMELCKGIRSGKFDGQSDALLKLLLDETVNNVRVVRPDHLDEMHAGTIAVVSENSSHAQAARW